MTTILPEVDTSLIPKPELHRLVRVSYGRLKSDMDDPDGRTIINVLARDVDPHWADDDAAWLIASALCPYAESKKKLSDGPSLIAADRALRIWGFLRVLLSRVG